MFDDTPTKLYDPMPSSSSDDAPLRSQFTYRHLSQLSKSSVDCPFRVISHIDLDAFYAQCEMKRLGLPKDEPLAVQQWANLIAVNYPARDKGVTRHIEAAEAKKLCPNIHLIHVAVWTPNSQTWSYPTTPPPIGSAKASLDPYRTEGKKILSLFRSSCPSAILEKAGIDESFLDLSKPVYDLLLTHYPILRTTPSDPSTPLPPPPQDPLNWHSSHLVSATIPGAEATEEELATTPIDWDDIVLSLGCHLVSQIRSTVFRTLGYTTGGGISTTKTLAKLASAFKKPNQQTVIRTSAIQPFLNTYNFTKLRNLGGKLGKQLVEHLGGSELLVDLYGRSLQELTAWLGEESGAWVFNVIRGVDRTPVTPRTAIKSMLSAKSFRPPSLPKDFKAALSWIRLFVADIQGRIDEEDTVIVRRPKVMSITFTNKAGSRSKQMPLISTCGFIRESMDRTAEKLLKEVTADGGGNVWPCIRLSIDVSGFEEKEVGSRDIGTFFKRKRDISPEPAEAAPVAKRIRTPIPPPPPPQPVKQEPAGIASYFQHPPSPPAARSSSSSSSAASSSIPKPHPPADPNLQPPAGIASYFQYPPPARSSSSSTSSSSAAEKKDVGEAEDDYFTTCSTCGVKIPHHEEGEHKDWHVAKAMEEEWRREEAERVEREKEREREREREKGRCVGGGAGRGKGKVRGRGGEGTEKGQMKLKFG